MKEIAFDKFGVMIDCSRNAVITAGAFERMADILSELGYTKEELKRMDAYAARRGIELIPCIQTLAHLGTIFRYAKYGKIKDIDDIILVGDERTYTLIDNMFKSLSECFTWANISKLTACATGRR